MNRIFIFIIFLFIALPSFAQITKANLQLSSYGEPMLVIKVKDKKTSAPMSGAYATIHSAKDTLHAVSGNDGMVVFNKLPFRHGKDSLNLTISFLGYKTLQYKYIHSNTLTLDANMEEDPQQLGEIIVKGDAVAMVVKGDTTIFNASAYPSLEDSDLFSLLKKLPGINANGGILQANGVTVSKILINGTALFSSNIGAALNLVKSKDVNKVKVYDQYDQNRLLEADTLGRKERVVDVEMKKPINEIRNLRMIVAAGIYNEKSAKSDHKTTGLIGGEYNRFGVNLPSYSIKGRAGHNYSGDSRPSDTPGNSANLNFITSLTKKFKNSYNHFLNINYDNRKNETLSEKTYFPSGYFTKKKNVTEALSSHNTISTQYRGGIGFALGDNDMITTTLSLNYTGSKGNSFNRATITTDGTGLISNISDRKNNNQFTILWALSYKHNFKKKGRCLEIGADISWDNANGTEYNIDTTKTSYIHKWLNKDLKRRAAVIGFSSAYIEPLSDRFLLSADYTLSAGELKSKRFSYNVLLSENDLMNTYDFIHKSFSNKWHGSLDFNNPDKSLIVSAGMQYDLSSQIKEEFLPESSKTPRGYSHLSPKISLSYRKSSYNISLLYNEQQIIPDITSTRDFIDDSYPLFITAGNPDLKQEIIRSCNLNMNISLPEYTGSIDLFANYIQRSSSIGRKTIFFKSDTHLPKYDYTVPGGAQFSIPVNMEGSHSLISTLNWTGYSNRLNTTFTLGPEYSYTRNPFIIGEDIHRTVVHDIGINTSISSTISRYLEINISSLSSLGYNMLDETKSFRSFNEELTAGANAELLKIFRLRSNFTWDFLSTDNADASGYHREIWDLGLSCKFGKKPVYEIGFDCYDILNRNISADTLTYENYICSTYRDIYGTSLLLSFKCEF